MKAIALGLMLTAGATVAVAQQKPAASAKPAAVPAYITAALADPARAEQAGDDARRQAAAVLAFSGVKPGDTVIDYLPGKGYWTRILSGIVGPKGHVYAYWPAAAQRYAEKSLGAIQALNLPNATVQVQAVNIPAADQPIDLFWTVQNYHDVANKDAGEPALRAFDQAVFKLLKSGGTYVIIDHADTVGKGLADTNTTHRIDPDYVKRQVQSVGFRFVGESRVLRNPEDDHSKNVFDPAIRGRTDQFVYKFRKP
ncbi:MULTISPECIES: methyltransferase [unclassified Sphingomonas]|uniref:class I SAM-dependent methyltransferase n=1 Tax=unclassified Sphingomonas TaxID=196159 RepID=UPI00285691CD|nr:MULTISPECIES: methyltransferase [unclassified Sphingomonas]MDR6114608.1 putative methyltransferase [Sphingomonas sp. SORGH_AS_0789]MDR6151719.1 putative methyltransferase [Sphingomonas sp. SORGH_AS_0742]